jgi:hypothetical protein
VKNVCHIWVSRTLENYVYGPTNALICNTSKTLIPMSHIKTLKITPTCFDHLMMIIWWSKHVGVILSVLMCDIWINVLLQTSALVGHTHSDLKCTVKQWNSWKTTSRKNYSRSVNSLLLLTRVLSIIILLCLCLYGKLFIRFVNANVWLKSRYKTVVLYWQSQIKK